MTTHPAARPSQPPTTGPRRVAPGACVFAGIALAAAVGALGGCSTLDTSGSGDSYSYIMGSMSTTETARLPAAFEAARTVLESSGYRVTSMTRDDIKGNLLGEKPQGRQCVIDVEQLGLERVRIEVRVGVIGDRDESRRILDAIRLRL